MIQTDSLTKRYGRLPALERLTMTVPAGSVLGVLGPNGAGKTTLLRVLGGLTRPTAGNGSVVGWDLAGDTVAIRRVTALVHESKMLYRGMSAEAFLRLYAGFFPDASVDAAHALLRQWRVEPDRRVDALSRGARTKILLAAALARRPKLFLLDEPSEGLDPNAVEDLWSRLFDRVGDDGGAGAVLSTHRVEEAERVCDRILVLHGGDVALEGDLEEVRMRWRRIIIRAASGIDVAAALPGVVATSSRQGLHEVTTSAWHSSYPERLPRGAELLETRGMGLREIYLTVVGHAP